MHPRRCYERLNRHLAEHRQHQRSRRGALPLISSHGKIRARQEQETGFIFPPARLRSPNAS